MPRNRFAFSIRVGREYEFVGITEGFLDVSDPFFGLRIHIPAHGELIFRINGAILRG